MPRRPRRLTAAEVEVIRELAGRGLSAPKVAAAIGRDVDAVRSRMADMGIPPWVHGQPPRAAPGAPWCVQIGGAHADHHRSRATAAEAGAAAEHVTCPRPAVVGRAVAGRKRYTRRASTEEISPASQTRSISAI